MRTIHSILLLAILLASLPKEWLHHDDHAHAEGWICLPEKDPEVSAHTHTACEENGSPCEHSKHFELPSHSCWLELIFVSAPLPSLSLILPELSSVYLKYTYLLYTYLLYTKTTVYFLRGPPTPHYF